MLNLAFSQARHSFTCQAAGLHCLAGGEGGEGGADGEIGEAPGTPGTVRIFAELPIPTIIMLMLMLVPNI